MDSWEDTVDSGAIQSLLKLKMFGWSKEICASLSFQNVSVSVCMQLIFISRYSLSSSTSELWVVRSDVSKHH